MPFMPADIRGLTSIAVANIQVTAPLGVKYIFLALYEGFLSRNKFATSVDNILIA
jgi:hypothetical protein